MIEQLPSPVQDETLRAQIWRRFRRHPGAVMGMIVLSLLLLLVLGVSMVGIVYRSYLRSHRLW